MKRWQKSFLKDNTKGDGFFAAGENILALIPSGSIVGMVKDFNFNSLHYKIETMFLFNQKDWGFQNGVSKNQRWTREGSTRLY